LKKFFLDDQVVRCDEIGEEGMLPFCRVADNGEMTLSPQG
jgi:hypothetical protein